MEMLFNNKLISHLIKIIDVERETTGERVLNSLQVPSRDGEIFQNVYFGTKTIAVSFYLTQEYLPTYLNGTLSKSEFTKYVQSLAFYLTTDKPAKLIFSDNPSQYHLAIMESFNIERVLKLGQGTIVFKCFDPFLYDTQTCVFDATNDGIVTITNDGTASSYPTIVTMLGSDATHLSYVSKNGVIQIGNPNATYEYSEPSNPIIKNDLCTSTLNWYKGSSTLLYTDRLIDDNVNLVSDGYGLKLNTQPEGEEGSGNYVGAFYLSDLDEDTKYWRADINFTFKSYNGGKNCPEQRGMIEFLMYDKNNVPIMNFSMRDFHTAYMHNTPMWHMGATTHAWNEKGTLGSGKNWNTTAQYVDSTDELPEDAQIIYETAFPKKKVVVKNNGTPVYASYSSSSKLLFKVAAGAEYSYANKEIAGWLKIYLNSEKTSVGWIANHNVDLEDDGTQYLVTYKQMTDSSSQGNWNWFTGTVILERQPHPNGIGSIWMMRLHKKSDYSYTNNVTHVAYKTIYDPNNKLYSNVYNDLSKIGVYIASYEDSPMVGTVTLDDVVIRKYTDNYNSGDSLKYIGKAGDVITVDCGKQMVYKNDIEFMEFVDIGSEFFSIPAFSTSEIRVITDDESSATSVKLTKRYL